MEYPRVYILCTLASIRSLMLYTSFLDFHRLSQHTASLLIMKSTILSAAVLLMATTTAGQYAGDHGARAACKVCPAGMFHCVSRTLLLLIWSQNSISM